MTRDEMKAALAKGVCTVIFEKLDGTERTMKCTTNLEYVPEEAQPRTSRDGSDRVIAAYDVTLAGWRSFRVESVKEFTV
jgi:hypothetical protein